MKYPSTPHRLTDHSTASPAKPDRHRMLAYLIAASFALALGLFTITAPLAPAAFGQLVEPAEPAEPVEPETDQQDEPAPEEQDEQQQEEQPPDVPLQEQQIGGGGQLLEPQSKSSKLS